MVRKTNIGKFDVSQVEVIEEECRLNLVKSIVDAACGMIVSGAVPRGELELLAEFTKKSALNFIPGQEELYDMIYGARLMRYAEQFRMEDENDRNDSKSE